MAELDVYIDHKAYEALGIQPAFDRMAYVGLMGELAGDEGLASPPIIQIAPHKPLADGINIRGILARTVRPSRAQHGYSRDKNTITVLTGDDVHEANQHLLHETGRWAVDVKGLPTDPESVRAAATAEVCGAIACIGAGIELGRATHSKLSSGLATFAGLALYTSALIRSTRRQQKAEVQQALANSGTPKRFGNIITLGRAPETD